MPEAVAQMRDLAGFALLLMALLLGLFILVQWVIPFVATWFAGLVTFLLAALILIHRGRRLPRHLPGLLDNGTVVALLACALLFPSAHAALTLLTETPGLWPVVLAINLFPALALAVRTAVLHERDRRRRAREGIDFLVLHDRLISLAEALQVLHDRLDLASATRPDPEPWELVAGTALGITEVPLGDVQRLIERSESLMGEVRSLEREVSPRAEAIRTRGPDREDREMLPRWESRQSALKQQVDTLLREAEECLGEEPNRPLSSWIP